jgi:large subunit ribosomal protein L37Ae
MSRRRRRTSFGHQLRTRGGATVRKEWSRIVSNMRRPHKCPSCAMPYVKRVSVGVWECRKCGYKFAGGAYVPTTRTGQASQRIRQPT